MDSRMAEVLIGAAHDWDRAMVTNDPEAIGACWNHTMRKSEFTATPPS